MDKCTPRYKALPPAEDMPKPMERPTLKVCQIVNSKLVLPKDVRAMFLSCPVFGPDWRQLLTDFDKQWGNVSQPNEPTPAQGGAGLKQEQAKVEAGAVAAVKKEAVSLAPPGFNWDSVFVGDKTTYEDVKKHHGSEQCVELPTTIAGLVLVITPGPCLYAVGKDACVIETTAPIISHGAGAWLLGDKANKFITNSPGKGFLCHWTNDEVPVVLLNEVDQSKINCFGWGGTMFEQYCSAALLNNPLQEDNTDSAVMTLRSCLQLVERSGFIEYTVGGHQCSRPADVTQGKMDDKFELSPEQNNPLVWKATAINSKQLKSINCASHFSADALEGSPLVCAFWFNFSSFSWRVMSTKCCFKYTLTNMFLHFSD